MSETVKRYDCSSGGAKFCQGCYTMEECEHGDYVQHEDYARLEQECERLHAIIDSTLEQFPFNADRQKFTFNGQEVTADGDDLFYSVKRVNAFLCEVHDALSAKP